MSEVIEFKRGDWNKVLEQKICDRIALGQPVQKILEEAGMPSWETVRKHLAKDEAFREEYELARIAQADYLADQMLGYVKAAVENPRDANGYKVAADILRWQAMVRAPRKYSDRMIQENTSTPPADPERVRSEIERLKKELGVK